MKIQQFKPADEPEVIDLWRRCDLVRPWNDPRQDIARKLKVNPELFLVGLVNDKLIATAMAGYEGHRGWVNYLAIDPGYRRNGYGRQMMRAVEEKLTELGCPKLNLQVRKGNDAALVFYEHLGYKVDEVTSLGKRLIEDGR